MVRGCGFDLVVGFSKFSSSPREPAPSLASQSRRTAAAVNLRGTASPAGFGRSLGLGGVLGHGAYLSRLPPGVVPRYAKVCLVAPVI